MGQTEPIEVICQHCKDGSIIPIKIRLQDEDDLYQVYMIKSSRQLEKGASILPSEGFIYGDVLRYECKIEVFGVQKRIRLHYNKSQTKWNIYY